LVTITTKEFQQMASYIKRMYGIHLKMEKTALLIGRLHQLLMQKGFATFSEYYDYVVSDHTGAAALELIDKVSTNHTFFMRETEHFHFFRDEVVPYMEGSVSDKDLRIWCAGCSTGQESYTLAMILNDYFLTKPSDWDTKLLATDISSRVLQQAVSGEYSAEQIVALPKHWQSRYFKRLSTGKYQVDAKIKAQVIYRKFNLMEPRFPFRKKFHAIFCRNVMIYFDKSTRDALVDKLWERTEPNGYLFISQSESIDREKTPYKYVMPGVYRKDSH